LNRQATATNPDLSIHGGRAALLLFWHFPLVSSVFLSNIRISVRSKQTILYSYTLLLDMLVKSTQESEAQAEAGKSTSTKQKMLCDGSLVILLKVK